MTGGLDGVVRPGKWMTCAACLLLCVGLLVSGAASSQPMVTDYACKPPQQESAACASAKQQLDAARLRYAEQQDRVRAINGLIRVAQEIPENVERLPRLIARSDGAWIGFTKSASAAREAAGAATDSCRQHDEAASAYLSALANFRAAAIGFAQSPAKHAKALAQRADQLQDRVQHAKRDVEQARLSCVAKVNELLSAHGVLQRAHDEFSRSMLSIANLGEDLNRQVATGTHALTQHASEARGSLSRIFDSVTRLAGSLDPTKFVEPRAATEALMASTSAAMAPLASASDRLEAQLDQVLTTLRVTEDSLAFGRVMDEKRKAHCAADATCVEALAARALARQTASQAAHRTLEDLLSRRRTAMDGYDRMARALAPAAFNFDQWHKALLALPTTLDIVPDPDLPKLVAVLSAERDAQIRQREQLLAELNGAELMVYGRRDQPMPVHPVAQASAGAYPLSASAAAMPNIASEHAHQFIAATVPELPDFAAYTYVYLPDRSSEGPVVDRYLSTIRTVVEKSVKAENIPTRALDRGRFNLMCLPSIKAAARNQAADKPGPWLLEEYDLAYMEHLLLSSHSGVVLRHLVSTRQGSGPYLLTTRKRLGDTRSGDWLLFVDLSGVPKDYARDMVLGYMKRFEEPPPKVLGAKDAEEWKPTLAQRTFMTLSAFSQVVASLQSQTGFNVAKALGGGDTSKSGATGGSPRQSFVSVSP